MKQALLALSIAATFAVPMTAAAQTVLGLQPTDQALHGGSQPSIPTTFDQAQYLRRLALFRERALAQERADGGRLTPGHKADLQYKLYRLNEEFGIRSS